MKKLKEKLFVIRKYIKAKSAADAIKKDKTHAVDDVWIDDEWKKGQATELAAAIGFRVDPPQDETEDY